MTFRSVSVRKVLVLALLASALHVWAEEFSFFCRLQASCADALPSCLCSDGESESEVRRIDAAQADPHPVISLRIDSARPASRNDGTQAMGPFLRADAFRSSDYRSEVFRPPSA